MAGAHGIRGLVRVILYHTASHALLQARQLRIGEQVYPVLTLRPLGSARPACLLNLEGVATRDAAQALAGAEVAIAREQLDLAADEFFVADLVGCEAQDQTGRSLGRVEAIFDSGAHEVLVLAGDLMVPLVPEWVLSVDLEQRRLVVDLHTDDPS